MMEILHLLPAAFETLFSVYWLSACHFCTVDVNSEKKKKQQQQHRSRAETKACSHSWECEIRGSTRRSSKLYFFAVESASDL